MVKEMVESRKESEQLSAVKVVDADAHVEESTATWEFLDPDFYAQRPLPILIEDKNTRYGRLNAMWLIEGQVHPKTAGPGYHIFITPPISEWAKSKSVSIGAQTLTDVPARLADMDRLGIELQVVFPTAFLVPLCDDLKLEKALCQSYNRFMADACKKSGGRIFFAAVMPQRDMKDAVEVVQEAKKLGAVAAMTLGLNWDKTLSDPNFFPLYEELSRLELPLVVHFGWGSPSFNHIANDLENTLITASFPVLMGFYSMMASGIYEQFPRLRVAFFEVGGGWLPWMMEQLERRYRSHTLPKLKRSPAELLQMGNIYLSVEPDENLEPLLKHISEEQLVTASDYPHEDPSSEEDMVGEWMGRMELPEATRKKILSTNALRLYNL